MMRLLVCALILASGAPAAAQGTMLPPTPSPAGARPAAAPAQPRFANPADFDFARLLPPPPTPESVAGMADLETILQVQASRTPEQVEWAKVVERDTIFNHATVLGTWFTASNLPVTAAFFKAFEDDLRWIDRVGKEPFLRPRPSVSHASVEPAVTVSASSCYPSGTAIQAFVWAELLAEIFPAQRSGLVARAHRAAWARVIGGVHYPSDLVAGRLLAAPLLESCRKRTAFREGLAAVQAEMLAVAASQPK